MGPHCQPLLPGYHLMCFEFKPALLLVSPKLSKVVTEGMLTDSGKPATPRRIKPMQALSGLFRTPTRLHTPTTVSRCHKRTRTRASSLSSPISSTPGTPPLPPAVVLQTYSVSTDSIVLTALPTVPFCCHEDLLTMSRAQLEGVARALNMRLPSRMRICPEDDFWQNGVQDSTKESDGGDDGLSRMSEVEMKKRIEELVGIRPIVGKNRVSRLGLGLDTYGRVPPAPKAVRTRNAAWRPFEKTPWEMEVDDAEDQADELGGTLDEVLMGSSPLASRTKSGSHMRGRSGTLSLLPILQEENEGNDSKEDSSQGSEGRPPKRQRVFSESATQHFQQFDQILKDTRESRLVENMDVSGSPLLAGEDDPPSRGSSEAVRVARSLSPGAKMLEEETHVPLQRRRSARIREIALKRASSVDPGKRMSFDGRSVKSTVLHSRTFSPRGSPDNNSSARASDTGKGSNTPREIAVCLPFTSTPPHLKPESSVWSASRILRSHSQRLLGTKKLTETRAPLERSRSERYPRASDLAFVTIDRPKYRFSARKSKGTKSTNRIQELHPLLSLPPAQVGGQPQQDSQIRSEHSNSKSRYGREGHRIGMGPLPSALCNLLSPRSRALSTSTLASLTGTGDTPAQDSSKRTANMVSASSDGTTERILEALGRMAVDSRAVGSSEEC